MTAVIVLWKFSSKHNEIIDIEWLISVLLLPLGPTTDTTTTTTSSSSNGSSSSSTVAV